METPSPSKVQTRWIGGHHPCENIVSQPKQLKKHMQTKPKSEWKKPGPKTETDTEPKVVKVREKSGPKPKPRMNVKFVSGKPTTIIEHCQKLVQQYGTETEAAKVLRVSRAYFKNLLSGEMVDPSEEFALKIGLKRTVTYEVL